jgi:hypothetical protein
MAPHLIDLQWKEKKEETRRPEKLFPDYMPTRYFT